MEHLQEVGKELSELKYLYEVGHGPAGSYRLWEVQCRLEQRVQLEHLLQLDTSEELVQSVSKTEDLAPNIVQEDLSHLDSRRVIADLGGL